MFVNAIAFCLNDAATTLYALNQEGGAGQCGVWVVDVASGLLTDFIFITNPYPNGFGFGERLQVYNGKLWCYSTTGENFAQLPGNKISQLDITSRTTTSFALSDFSRIDDIAIAGGVLYVFGVSWTQVLYSPGTSTLVSTTLTDPGVDFIAAGVTTGDVVASGLLANQYTVGIASVDGPHQLTLAAVPVSFGPDYTVITPVSLGTSPICADTIFNNIVIGNYDPATGAGSSSSTPGVAGDSTTGCIHVSNVNRQTQAIVGMDTSVDIYQASGLTTIASPLTIGSQYTLITDDGHIILTDGPGSPVSPDTWVIASSISDGSPTGSIVWPVGGQFPLQAATLSGDVYGLDNLGNLGVMHGSGPTITITDTLSDGASAVSGNRGQGIIGDETNNGLWVIYADHVIFWSVGSQTTTVSIPFVPPNFGFSFSPNPATLSIDGEVVINVPTTFSGLPDLVTNIFILGGGFANASIVPSGLPIVAGGTPSFQLISNPPGDVSGTYTFYISVSGAFSGDTTEPLTVSLTDSAEVVNTPIVFFEGYGHSGQDIFPLPAEIVLNVRGDGSILYLLRAACSSAPGGYIYWENFTGDDFGKPPCMGTLGPTVILVAWRVGS